MTGSDRERRRPRRAATAIVQSGRDPFAHHGFAYRGSTVLLRTVESFEKRDQRYVNGLARLAATA